VVGGVFCVRRQVSEVGVACASGDWEVGAVNGLCAYR